MYNMEGVNGGLRSVPMETGLLPVPLGVGASPTSGSSSDMYLYDDSSMSDGSLYASDQENHSTPLKRSEYRRHHKRRSRCPQQQIQQRQAANMRERRRMQSINDAFEGLRAHIPTLPYEKRLSKVDTLKLAIGYISFLGELVLADKNSNDVSLVGIGKSQSKEEHKKVIVRVIQFNARSEAISLVETPAEPTSETSNNFQAHSLSWSRRGDRQQGSTLHAKIWMPEDPRNLNAPNGHDKDELR